MGYQSSRKRHQICDALRDLVPFVQFKKREKHQLRGVNFSKVAGLKPATLIKLTLLHGCFSRFLNCANDTKSRNAPNIYNESLFSSLSLCLLYNILALHSQDKVKYVKKVTFMNHDIIH